MNKMRSTIASALASAALLIAPAARAASGDISVTGSTQSDDGRLATISLSLPASATASTLWLAWGAADCGDQIGNWDDLEYLGDVPAGDTTWTGSIGTIPAGKPYARVFRIAADASLAELESVKASGGAYVLTGFTPTGSTVVRCDCRFDDVTSGFALFGARETSSTEQFDMIYTPNQGFRFDYGSSIQENTYKYAAAGVRYIVDYDYTGLQTNGVYVSNINSVQATFQRQYPMAVFAVNTANAPGAKASATMYSFQAWSDTARTTLALDLVPCAKNGVAGLYDRIAGAFYPSATDTALVSGTPKTHSTCGDLVGSSAVLRPYGTDRTVAVANFYREGRRPTADLTFTAGLADCALVAVHGPADAGDDIADWPNAAFLGTVPAATTAMTATIPWTIPDETPHFFRFFLVSPIDPATGDSLRLFEGLHADNGPYVVVTDFTATGDTCVQATFAMDDTNGAQVLFSGRDANSQNTFTVMCIAYQGAFCWRFDYDASPHNSTAAAAEGQAYCLDADYRGLRVGTSSDDLTAVVSPAGGAAHFYSGFTAGSPLTVFALNTGGSISALARAVCYGFKAWSDRARTTLALDLVPCERNGVAGFWDNAGAKFYGNSAGTGTLEATGAEILNADATVLSRSATLPLPPPTAFTLVVR